MSKKTIALLMAAFVGAAICFTGCSEKKKEVKAEAKAKVEKKKDTFDLSSKEATVKTFIKAIRDQNADQVWNCFSPDTRKVLEAAAVVENKSVSEYKQALMKEFKRDEMEKEIQTRGLDAVVAEGVKEMQFVQVDGKWYLDLSDEFKNEK